MLKRILFVLIQVIPFTLVFAQPTITSFTPAAGKVGTSITISGTNFSATPSNNTVYIGNTKATALSSTATSITANVPSGAIYNRISVNVSNLQGFSSSPFITTYGNNESISSSTFGSGSSLTTTSQPSCIEIADIDLDGKVDIIVSSVSGQRVSIFRNLSTSGSMSFASRFDLTTPANCNGVTAADVDGDGKIDLIGTNTSTANSISVFRNTSTSGNISFATKVDFSAGNNPFHITFADINNDGKPEIVNGAFSGGQIAVHENTSSSGTVTFSSVVLISSGSGTSILAADDIDGDGKVDIVANNFTANTISTFRNIHSSGAISSSSFSKSDISVSGNPQHISLADIDGDGKKDLVCTYQGAGNLVIHRNTSTSGSISFASAVSYTSGTTARSALVADVNGDGTPDVITSNIGSNNFRVYENSSTPGTISLSSGTTFSTNSQPYYAFPADIDGDTKPDMITANYGANNIQVFRNTQLATEPSTASSFMSFSSLTANSMTVSWANGNGARRIVALKASGTPPSVTSPVDATEYTANASFGSGADLGSGWYVVYDGTGSSVSVSDLTLNQQYYCVIFEYNGKDATINYQTSYASGTQLLPVEFLSFTATGSEKGVQLNWSTAWEINNSHFEIERSINNISDFIKIDEIKGQGNSIVLSDYVYDDNNIKQNVLQMYYRLKQVDFNGVYKYSNVAVASLKEEKMNMVGPEAFPTVVYKEFYVKMGSIENKLISVTVVDSRGQPLHQSPDNVGKINCLTWDAGIYHVLIDYFDAYGILKRQATKISKQ